MEGLAQRLKSAGSGMAIKISFIVFIPSSIIGLWNIIMHWERFGVQGSVVAWEHFRAHQIWPLRSFKHEFEF
jgi:hypothetical protein